MLTPAPVSFLPEVLITLQSARHGLGLEGLSGFAVTAPASANWGSANFAFYYPIYMDRPGLVTKFFTLNGATALGNTDIGLYSRNYTKISSSGAVAQAGTNVLQEFNVTDFRVTRGVYFLGLTSSSSTSTFFRSGAANAAFCGMMGITMENITALPLPATATPAIMTSAVALPVAGIAFRALVA